MDTLRVGAKAKCVNSGALYPTYDRWIKLNAPEYLGAYHNSYIEEEWNAITDYPFGREGIIIQIAPHSEWDIDLYLIKTDEGDVFLLSSYGLEAI